MKVYVSSDMEGTAGVVDWSQCLAPEPEYEYYRGLLQAEVVCAAFGPGSGFCPPGSAYPQPTTVTMLPIPHHLTSMDEPCSGVPNNPWCG